MQTGDNSHNTYSCMDKDQLNTKYLKKTEQSFHSNYQHRMSEQQQKKQIHVRQSEVLRACTWPKNSKALDQYILT